MFLNQTGRRIIISVVAGGGLTGFGVAFMVLDHWGPCGPHSVMGQVGGFLTIEHVNLFSSAFRAMNCADLPSGIPGILGVTLLPWMDWALVVFLGLTLWSRILLFRRGQLVKSMQQKP